MQGCCIRNTPLFDPVFSAMARAGFLGNYVHRQRCQVRRCVFECSDPLNRCSLDVPSDESCLMRRISRVC